MRLTLSIVSLALLVITPAVAADQSGPENTPPATMGADTSSGAKEQSSAPPASGAAEDLSNKSSAGASGDTSTGAKEQSSAPPGSAAATGQPPASNSMTSDKP
jgi:hypothetical protein